jgi:hypothetical protein
MMGPKTKNDCDGEGPQKMNALLRTTVGGYQLVTSQQGQKLLSSETVKGIPIIRKQLPSNE